MSKAVLISISPKWCDLIASGKKTIEVRKTVPKLEIPFTVYIYCTLNGCKEYFCSLQEEYGQYEALCKWDREHWAEKKGNVIGEFTCDEIKQSANGIVPWGESDDCLTDDEIESYSGGKEVYGCHISDLVIYDKPKELREFYRMCHGLDDVGVCWGCDKAIGEEHDCGVNGEVHLSRPPQSWCYVEELK